MIQTEIHPDYIQNTHTHTVRRGSVCGLTFLSCEAPAENEKPQRVSVRLLNNVCIHTQRAVSYQEMFSIFSCWILKLRHVENKNHLKTGKIKVSGRSPPAVQREY